MSIRKPDEESLGIAERLIGVRFREKRYLVEALTHRSVHVNDKTKRDNERLEHLGDAILGFVIVQYLFRGFPDKEEGWMTSVESVLFRTSTLAQLAEKLGLADCLFLGDKRVLENPTSRVKILGSAMEALIAAIYLDQGIGAAELFIIRHVMPKLKEVTAHLEEYSPKCLLQNTSQEFFKVTPTYKVLKEEGLDHDRTFYVGVYIGKQLAGRGVGKSIKEAEEGAARNALAKSQL